MFVRVRRRDGRNHLTTNADGYSPNNRDDLPDCCMRRSGRRPRRPQLVEPPGTLELMRERGCMPASDSPSPARRARPGRDAAERSHDDAATRTASSNTRGRRRCKHVQHHGNEVSTEPAEDSMPVRSEEQACGVSAGLLIGANVGRWCLSWPPRLMVAA